MTTTCRQISSKVSATRWLTSTSVPPALFHFVFAPLNQANLDPAVYYAHLAGNRARAHDPSRDRDEDSSASGTGPLSAGMARLALDAVTPLKPLHANIQDTMWWL